MAVVGIDEATALIWADGAWRTEGAGNVVVHRHDRWVDLSEVPPLELGVAG
jgi:hypothetical protein